ncbi:hypothetical protein DYB37_006756 [Aphanomyces astaci]|uniref:DDE-1 domain-containing protein n=2 Tax=Aphanomyces astaci TaxID=112090 RepID=A0A418F0M6_APHAT|nr:hypothetical protein DYB37_006756 [Aphanomyces astaci]
MPTRHRKKSYSIDEKRKLLAMFEATATSHRKFCAEHGIPRSTWIDWQKRRTELATTRRNAKRPTLGGQGAKAIFPFKYELLAFMKDVRREEHILTSMHMVTFMKRNHGEWLASYRTGKRDAYKSLLKLCQEFAKRHGFSQRVACFTKMPTPDMLEIRQDFACKFWTKYHAYAASEIMNVDETAVYYDMPPGKIWAEIGKSSKVDKKQKHSDRITAVLTCRADGSKLPILFIVHGVPGGTIDEVELDTYPEEHYYSVQESAWMDSRVWKAYLEILPPYIEGPTVIVADNFDAHVTQESANVIAGDLHSVLEPLPANCTSVCQPLDVGVMGPFKKLLRTLWLDEAPVTSAADKRRAMILRSIKAWEMISSDAIQKSFQKAIPRPHIVVV